MTGTQSRLTALSIATLVAACMATPASAQDYCDIRAAQEMLEALGYDPGPIDGRWGPSTRRAVISFQIRSGVFSTGRLSRATCDALPEALREQQDALAQASAEALREPDDPNLVVIREWSGAVRTFMQCEPGEAVFYGETFVPCGSTFKNYSGQIGGGMVFAGARRGPEDPCKSLADLAAYASGDPKARYQSVLARARGSSFRDGRQICREALP